MSRQDEPAGSVNSYLLTYGEQTTAWESTLRANIASPKDGGFTHHLVFWIKITNSHPARSFYSFKEP